eukprot:Seg7612.2 transcript_id=Seg7612.2/GoldUCD/mRNA.D3Y31 product="hypothetical protein" protein_id=Seg7612.2/GoldUCD/D3Y31
MYHFLWREASRGKGRPKLCKVDVKNKVFKFGMDEEKPLRRSVALCIVCMYHFLWREASRGKGRPKLCKVDVKNKVFKSELLSKEDTFSFI